MKNKAIALRHEEARMYKHSYRPSLNVLRFCRTIIGIFIFGQTSIATQRNHYKRK